MFIDERPLGSLTSRLRTESLCGSMKYSIFSYMVLHVLGASRTPQMMTSPTSPSAWRWTMEIVRMDLIVESFKTCMASCELLVRIGVDHS